jgi:hypothetical protein
MRAANITIAIAVVLWFSLALMGRDLAGGVASRMGGNVNINQFDYYVLWPAYVVAALLACAWACNTFRRWHWFLALTGGASLLALLPFMLFYTGGI